jgi:uncharacterized membrane protein YgdD (TMEM256/DUF423 family)
MTTPETQPSASFRIAAVLGLLGVALGAFGAHALKPTLAAFGTADIWETGVIYQLVHSVALLVLAAVGRADRWLTLLWAGGIVIFSGTLYIYATTGLKAFAIITPLGGLAFLAGWALLIIRGR